MGQRSGPGPKTHSIGAFDKSSPHSFFWDQSSSPSTHLVHKLGREIVSGGFKANALLPNEVEMRGRYSVSRTALREAYGKLTAKGLIYARPKVGTSVRPRADWNMLDQDVLGWTLQTVPPKEIADDLYTLRWMIEPSAAELAATMRTEVDLDKLEMAFATMCENKDNETELIEADYLFHVSILFATHNAFINPFSSLIRAAMVVTFQITWRCADDAKDDRLGLHGNVLRAIRERDARGARNGVEQLLESSRNDLKRVG